VLFFVVARAAWAQQKERFGHDAVEHAFVNAGALHLEVALDGKHLELQSLDPLVLLHTGDYKARIAKRDEKKNGFFSATYELLFADGTHWMFAEVGESE
jgi:hypothetical protein